MTRERTRHPGRRLAAGMLLAAGLAQGMPLSAFQQPVEEPERQLSDAESLAGYRGIAEVGVPRPEVATGLEAQPEFRAAWVDAWHGGFLSASQVTDLVNTLSGANYNVVIAEVRKCGDAYYDSEYEPRATNILDPPPFDPLTDLVSKAHEQGMELHAWIVTYRIWSSKWGVAPPGHVWSQHPEWAMKHSSGSTLDGDYYNLDPGVPGVQEYLCRVALDVVSRYDVDGFNWDYIRYPSGYTWGYNDITQQRFFDEYGFWPPSSTSSPDWETWARYRRRQITDLLRKCYLEILAVRPDVKMSVDTVGWTGGDPNVDFTQTRQYKEVFQDGLGWVEQHLVDANIAMNYKREYDSGQRADFRAWTDFACGLGNASARHGIVGQAAYLNSIADSVTQMACVRSAGCQGGATYSYASTNKDGRPGGEFWSAVRGNLYPTQAAVPEMPWKSASASGVVFGGVTSSARPSDPIYRHWLYQATVTCSGPVIRAALTDATGTYGFLDLPPGTYEVTAEKAGYPTQTYPAVAVSAGAVVRKNFDLSDGDGDGRVVMDDCDDQNGAVSADPGEAPELRFAADKVTMSWSAPADPGADPLWLYYDTLRAGSADGFDAATCLESDDGPERTAEDGSIPTAGLLFFYLVRGDNACPGEGTLGPRSDGSPRAGSSCP